MNFENRVVVLIDMDCFYCQVEEKLNPELKDKPIAVVQYNPWKGGGIIAVNYVARDMGVTRHMRGDEAKEKCPEIQLPSVPCQRGKADITKYRDAGKEVAKVLQKFTPLLERASIDEAYLDITVPVQERLKAQNICNIDSSMLPNTYALGYENVSQFLADVNAYGGESIDFDHENARNLAVGALIVSEIRTAVYNETGYRCSAGIAHNKILAKLVCSMNKPNKQTILPKHSVNILYNTLSVKKVKHLGGKFGDTVCELLQINKMGELQKFTEKELQAKFDEKNGTWLFNIARGIDLEPVQAKFNPKSIGCCKQFRGKSALTDLASLNKWLIDLGDEIDDRLEKDALETNRTPRQMVVSFTTEHPDGKDVGSSRSYNFSADDELNRALFSKKALELVIESIEGAKPKDVEENRKLKTPIKFLGISVGKFEDKNDKKTKKILDYFGASSSNSNLDKDNIQEYDKTYLNKEAGKEYIFKKFFELSNKGNKKEDSFEISKSNSGSSLISTLDKQESFFAKYLNKNTISANNTNTNVQHSEKLHVRTPVCNIIQCGEDSNDTEYSGSTINNEINQSIALFEDNPQDIDRVRSMRELIKGSIVADNDIQGQTDKKGTNENNGNNFKKDLYSKQINEIECNECGKIISIDMIDDHADYHYALKLNNEERLLARKEFKEGNNKKNSSVEGHIKSQNITSIRSFFVKIDETLPSKLCTKCGKKFVLDKFSEHLDFHEAQKLSRELNKKSVTLYTGNTAKRKRKSVSPTKKGKLPCKSIDAFFK